MKIACLGWGSLIWNPGDLKIKTEDWFNDGPNLPIEFIRISTDKRVTLVIDKESRPITTLWNLMNTNTLELAFDSLRKREGTIDKRIHFIKQNDVAQNSIQKTIQEWLITKELDVVIWTGLYLNHKTQDKRPSVIEIVHHLKSLKNSEFKKAKEYIIKTPNQVQTEYRKTIITELNWE